MQTSHALQAKSDAKLYVFFLIDHDIHEEYWKYASFIVLVVRAEADVLQKNKGVRISDADFD